MLPFLSWTCVAAESDQAGNGVNPSITLFELGYAVRHWSADEGLPDSNVRCFQLGPRGYLWLGTGGGGLARFNGFEFAHLTPAMPAEARLSEITDLLFESSGRRWLVGRNGRQVLIEGDRYRTFGSDEGAKQGIWAVTTGPEGDLWAARSPTQPPRIEILRFRNDRFERVTAPTRSGYPRSLEFDDEGRLWGTVAQRPFPGGANLFRLEGDRVEPVRIAGALQTVVLFHRYNGGLALAGEQGIYRLDDGEWVLEHRFAEPLPSSAMLHDCVEDEEGNFWFATFRRGLWVCPAGGGCREVVTDSFVFPSVCRAILCDPAGNIWVGTQNGLFQLHRSRFLRAPASERIRRRTIRSIGEDGEGTLWFTGYDRFYYLRPGEPMAQAVEPKLNLQKTMIAGRRNGSGAWGSIFGGPVFEQQVDKRNKLPGVAGPGSSFVRDLVETADDLWICRVSGLFRYGNGRPVRDQPAGIGPNRGAMAIADGGEGSLYAAFWREGLYRYRDGAWEKLAAEKGIRAIAVDPDGGVWALTEDGLLGWLGQSGWRSVSLGDLGVILEGGGVLACPTDGGLWLQPAVGRVIRLDRGELEQWIAGDRQDAPRFQRFGLADGLPSERSKAYPASIFEDSRNRIWVATERGAATHNPAYWKVDLRTSRPIPVAIERVSLDDTPSDFSMDQTLVLAPEAQRLEIGYVGIDLSNPEKVAYRYRLEGYDDRWIEAGTRRTAYYQSLPPGDYRFQVIAADRHGVWNDEGASLAVVVEPQWHETKAFRIAAPATVLLLVALAAFYRFHTINERARLKEDFSRGLIETQESERRRLAHELHDSLGQEMLVLKGRLDLAALKNPDSQEQFNQLSADFSGTIERARALSHELRPPHIEKLGLSKSLRSLAGDVQSASDLDVAAEIDELDPRLDATAELSLFRIAQEAVTNVLKHAEATRLDLRLGERDEIVTLRIEDNGRGFDPGKAHRSQSLGLSGMSERAQLFGGSFECDSAPDRGTRVTVRCKRPNSSCA